MAEVLRLLRLSLILRIAVSVLSVIAVGLTVGSNAIVLLLTTLPSLGLLALTSLMLTRDRMSERITKNLLVAAIVVQALESAGVRLFFRFNEHELPPDLDGFRRPDGASLAEVFLTRGLISGALFTAIPALLGAWVSGKRGVLGWSALAVTASTVAEVATVLPDFGPLRFVVSSVASQAVVIPLLAYFVGSLADQQREEEQQLKSANRQLAEQSHVREQLATSRERVRLARDLHDTLAHTLAGLVVQMNAIGTLLDKEPAAAKSELKKAQAAAKTGLEETRAAIGDLRANVVEDLGLSGALRRQADVLQQRGNAHVTFEQHGDEPQLTKDQAETMFRIAQEAMNNVERHAGAKYVMVTLQSPNGVHNGVPDGVSMSIKDDGVGFDISALDDDRFGLRGMRERAELISAHLRIDSAPAQGTTVTVTLRPASADAPADKRM